eukprot:4232047-Pyramimonas_sp.AAC.1
MCSTLHNGTTNTNVQLLQDRLGPTQSERLTYRTNASGPGHNVPTTARAVHNTRCASTKPHGE